MERSARGKLMVVIAVTELLAALRSISLAETLAVLVRIPAADAPGTTTTVTVAVAPTARGPRFPVTVVALVSTLPCDEAAETRATFAGNESLKETNEALFGPALVTVNV